MSTKKVLEITGVDRIDGDHVLVEYSDGSSRSYTMDDLLSLQPVRELSNPPEGEDA